MKTCSKCGGEPKPPTEFSKDASKHDGLRPNCKACDKATKAAWYSANREQAKANNVDWDAENRGRNAAYTAKWRAANPEKAAALATKWRSENPEKARAAAAKWYAANRDKSMAVKVKWYAANHERALATAAKWRAANPGKGRERAAKSAALNPAGRRIVQQNRRARKCANGGKLTKGLSDKLFKLQRGKCSCGCKQPLGDDYHLDHIMPLALGGANTDDNMQLLRAKCNLQKHAKHPIDFMQQRGFLL